jgi:hypothetical protein
MALVMVLNHVPPVPLIVALVRAVVEVVVAKSAAMVVVVVPRIVVIVLRIVVVVPLDLLVATACAGVGSHAPPVRQIVAFVRVSTVAMVFVVP